MDRDIMNVVYHCTDNYIHITATSILSLFEHNKSFREINVYIIENGFTDQTKKNCKCLAERYGRRIYFTPIGDIASKLGLNLVQVKAKWLPDSYSRLFLDEYLPEETERVLYLDGDTLITDDLHELWNIELPEGIYCAAAPDAMGSAYHELFGIEKGRSYCNSGVILFDLARWKESGAGSKVREYVKRSGGYIFFMEQTAFNALFQRNTKYIGARYNVTTTMQALSFDEILTIRKPLGFYTREEVSNALNNPAIIHMTAFFRVITRAWGDSTDHPERERFNKYHGLLGWGKFDMQKDKRNIMTRLIDLAVHVLPRWLVALIVSFLYNRVRIWRVKKRMKLALKNKTKGMA